MIDTNNLVGNEESITDKASIATVSKNTHVDAQVSSNKKSAQQKSSYAKIEKIVNAILASNINIIYKKHVIKIKVLGNEMLPKDFVGFIGKHADLLLKLHLQIDYIYYLGLLYNQTLAETIHEAKESCNARDAHELIIIKMIANYFDYFLKLLFENDHLLQLLQQKQFLYNLLVFYNSKMDLMNAESEDWTLAMQKFTPIMLTECYRIYNQFNIEACTIIDSLALTINFRQASLFSSIHISDGCTITKDKEIKKFINKQSAMMYEKDYIEDLLDAGDLLYFNQNGYCGVYKCSSQDDIIRTIDYLKAYSDIYHQNNIELDIDNIRLNGYRQFIIDYQKIDDPFVQKVCKKLLTAQD